MEESEAQTVAPPWYQSTLLWGCIGAFLSIVLTVVAAMMKDIRWLLFLAWPFAVFAAWEFVRTWSSRTVVVLSVTCLATVVIGALLAWLHFVLAPPSSPITADLDASKVAQMAPPKSTAAPAPSPSPQDRKVEATQSEAIYKCKTVGNPDRKTLEKNSADFKKYMEVYADTFGYKANILKVPGGDKAELTAGTPYGKKNMGSTTKASFEVRRIGKDLVGMFTVEFEDTFFGRIYAAEPLVPDSPAEIRIRKRIEDLAGVEKGDCELQ
jgi:hypothetical protein